VEHKQRRDAMRDLGAKVYMLMSGARIKNPALDAAVKDITAHIKGLEAELAKLEGTARRFAGPRGSQVPNRRACESAEEGACHTPAQGNTKNEDKHNMSRKRIGLQYALAGW
jgi:hypothetical protein